jgi:predicted ribosomally synthesized peptide with SipW-like signal peptide
MKKLLIGIIGVVVVIGLIGSAFAAFTANATDANNTFTAGNLVLNISNGGAYSPAITNTWKSPAGWAPGDTVKATLSATDTGSINSNHIYFDFGSLQNGGGTNGVNLMDAIIVTKLTETFVNTNTSVSVTTPDAAATIEGQVGNHDGKLTLRELAGFMPDNFGYYTVDDQSGDGVVLTAGDKKDYSITFWFTFDPAASNDYMNSTCSFNLTVQARQNSPTDGMIPLH